MSRTWPLKSGKSSGTCTVPSGPACIGGENSATICLRDLGQRAAALVAALAQHGRVAVGGRDQPSPIVADVEAELPPAEEVLHRVGRLEVGQPQHALIDGGQGHPGAGFGLQLQGHALPWQHLLRHARPTGRACALPGRCRPKPGRSPGPGANRRRRGTRAPSRRRRAPRTASTGTSTVVPAAGTSMSRSVFTRSVSVSSVACPANGATMCTLATLPGA